jgi:hypothetical protein
MHRAVGVFVLILSCSVGSARTASAQAPVRLPIPSAPAVSPTVDIPAVLADSAKLLVLEHAIRITLQPKTRDGLTGPFWSDYKRSVRIPAHWEDGDSWLVNYIGHAIHGAAAAFVWTSHDPVSRNEEFGLNINYWKTRWRPLAWSAAYSLEFEIGPLSEASIGNVGLDPATTGWVDHVVTPVAGVGLTIAEDALDRFFIRWFEDHVRNRFYRAAIRCIFNPARTMSNTSTGRVPWHRDGRPLGHTR